MGRNNFSFTVFGTDPAPQGSKKYVGTRRTAAGNNIPLIVESSPKLPAWRKAVNDAVVQALKDSGDVSKFDQAVKVEAVFYLTRPKTVSRAYPITPPDLDKLARGLLDGMKPCWTDDSLVVRLEVSKKYAVGQTGVAVTVTDYP
jgi:Holliday junction resolvase RusA-like endonuclease